MKKYMYLIAAAAAVLLVAGIVWAAGPAVDKPAFPGPGGPGDRLNLTTEQKGKLLDLQEKLFADMEKLNTDMAKKDFEMKRLFLAEKPDLKAIDKAQDEIKALADKRITLMRSFRDKARALLTSEQLTADPYAFMGPGGMIGGGPCPFGGPGPMGGQPGGPGPMGGQPGGPDGGPMGPPPAGGPGPDVK